jgi:hypothetical protein
MADNTYIKNDFTAFNFGYEFYNGKQVFRNAWTQNVIDDEVAKMRHSGLISDIDLEIVKFTYNHSFITARIARDLLMPDKSVDEAYDVLERLLKNRLLNKFAISSFARDDFPVDALGIYCLDYGGKKLLMHYGEPGDGAEKWTSGSILMSIPKVSEKLLSADFHVQLIKNCGSNLEYVKMNPVYRKSKDPVSPNFEFCIKYNGERKYFLGVVSRENNLQPTFRDLMAKVDDFVSSKSWMRYFYGDNLSQPIVIVIAENDRIALESAKLVDSRTSIKAIRYTTDERMISPLSEKGAFMKFVPEGTDEGYPDAHLAAVKSSVFSKPE